jgi:hypothetical protein
MMPSLQKGFKIRKGVSHILIRPVEIWRPQEDGIRGNDSGFGELVANSKHAYTDFENCFSRASFVSLFSNLEFAGMPA